NPAREAAKEIVEGADRAGEENARAAEQLVLDTVDVRPVRHDEDRVAFERGQEAVEQQLDLSRIGGPDDQAETHASQPSAGSRRLPYARRDLFAKCAEKVRPRHRSRCRPQNAPALPARSSEMTGRPARTVF